jgi:PAS domain S-box-containing protein
LNDEGYLVTDDVGPARQTAKPIGGTAAVACDVKKILIIDDEESVRNAVRLSLRSKGYTVLEASTGEEGRDLAIAERPDLILSDVNMKGMNGFALLEQLRAGSATATIPVILMTGVPEQATVRFSMEHGADDYLAKPFDSTALLAAVKARLDRQQILEANSKANETRLLELLSATHDLIAIADPRNGALLYLNSAGRKMLGLNAEDNISNLHLPDFLLDGQGIALAEKLAQARRDGLWVGESEIVRQGGGRVPVSEQIMAHAPCGGKAAYLSIVARDITERKRAAAELEKTHKELVEASRRAGMAEVATGVLHNVGNALTSINVASACMAESFRNSNAGTLSKVVALFRQHESDLGRFLSSDPKGKKIPRYLAQLGERLIKEQESVLRELAQLQDSVEHIKSIVTIQQNAAKTSGLVEFLKVSDLVEDALKMNARTVSSNTIQVTQEIDTALFVRGEKHKLLQILINLVRNAKQACDAVDSKEKKLTIRARNESQCVRIAVSDTGAGIPAENLNRIFTHGFTTKKDGHGFGLHTSALFATEMGGALSVESEGIGKGATFILELPKSPSD